MPAEVTRDEFRVLAREVEGEKMVTRHILEQTRRNGDDLAAVKTRLDRVENRLDRVENRLDRVELKLDGLAKSLPEIVTDAVRNAFDERDKRRT